MGRKDIKSYPKKVAEVDSFVKEMDDVYNGDHEKSIKYFQSNMLVLPIVKVEKACE
jgi:predicted glycosyltransferase